MWYPKNTGRGLVSAVSPPVRLYWVNMISSTIICRPRVKIMTYTPEKRTDSGAIATIMTTPIAIAAAMAKTTGSPHPLGSVRYVYDARYSVVA